MRQVRCRSHCRTCGQCFAGDSAFDAHRRGPVDARVCVDPEADDRFAEKTTAGVCGVRSDLWGGVKVWTLARNLERAAKEAWAA